MARTIPSMKTQPLPNSSKATTHAPARPLVFAHDLPPIRPADIINLDPGALSDPDGSFLKELISYLGNAQLKEAIACATRHLATHPKNPAVLNLCAALHLQNNEGLEAEKILQRAVREAPNDLYILNNLAGAFLLRDDIAGAERKLLEIIQRHPDAPPQVLYNRALCQFMAGHHDAAQVILDPLWPQADFIEPHILRARLAHVRLDWNDGLKVLHTSLQVFPHKPILLFYLAGFLQMQNQLHEAVIAAMSAVNAVPESWHYCAMYGSIVRMMTFEAFHPGHAQALIHALLSPGANPAHLAQPWLSALTVLDPWSELFANPRAVQENLALATQYLTTLRAQGALSHPYVLVGLNRTQLRHAGAERVFTGLRHALLMNADLNNGSLFADPADRAFAQALACQCMFNEYVYIVSDDEQVALDALHTRHKAGADADTLLLLSLYGPLTLWSDEKTVRMLASSESWLLPLIKFQIDEPAVEKRLMKDIPSLTPIRHAVSQAVEQMYLENPYPAWLSATYSGNQDFQHLARNPKDRLQILIAGCGTGNHAVNTALAYENCQVTAIDLSRRSLAYALRKTKEMDLANVTYAQADILELGPPTTMFDVIECSGVLHHLEDPERGLRVLLDRLKPRGILRLGLYSEYARRAVITGREAIAAGHYPPTPQGIRQFRHDVFAAADDSPLTKLLGHGDFYTVSTCRDLVFHVQEHRYTLPQIAALLEAYHLKFVNFQLEGPIMAAFQARYPNPADEFNLALWDEFEKENPRTFSNMYQFWTQKLS